MNSLYGDYQRQAEVDSLIHPGRKAVSTNGILLFFVALIPLLQHYQGIVVNPSLALTVILAVVELVRLMRRKIRTNVGLLLLLAYGLYASFVHGVTMTYLLREMVQIVIYFAVFNGLLDIPKLLKYYRFIAIGATILILLQYLFYYLFGIHLQMVYIPLLSPSASQWFGLIQTGRIGVTGSSLSFYRPSAFFLEPSHFAIYCTPVIVTTLFSHTGDEKRERMVALFVSLGVLLSTSGMGIGIVVLCWAIYLVFFYGQKGEVHSIHFKKLLNKRSIVLVIMFLLVLAVLYASVPVFRRSVIRIFVSSGNSGLTAIEGRTATGSRSLTMLEGIRRFIGFGDIYDISDWNMAAFYFVTFRFGWIGTVLFYSFYLFSLFQLKREAKQMTLMFLILSFFTVHMFGAYYKMYYTMIILYGYVQLREARTQLMTANRGESDGAACELV